MRLKSLVKDKDNQLGIKFSKRKCICCGETVVRLDFSQWGYKFGNKFCCSYHCMREMQQKYKKEKIKNCILSD